MGHPLFSRRYGAFDLFVALGLAVMLTPAVSRGQSTITSYPANGGSVSVVAGSGGTNFETTAIPSNGFYFLGWAFEAGGPIFVTNNPYLINLATDTFPTYAIFAAIEPPGLKITSPVRGARLRQDQISITGRASDLGVVTGVYYGVAATTNGPFAWFSATSENGFKTWSAKAILLSGANVAAAYAVGNAGVASATNFVAFQNKSAVAIPAALTGLAAAVTPDNGAHYRFSFDAGTFARESSDTNLLPGVGDYSYTVTSSNTAILYMAYTAPPALAGVTESNIVAFDSPSSGSYTNSGQGGQIFFAPIPTLAPASFAARREWLAGGGYIAFSDGMFSLDPSTNDFYESVAYGVFSWTRVSPITGYLRLNETDQIDHGRVDDVMVTFTSSAAANIFGVDYEPSSLDPSYTVAPVTPTSAPNRKTYFAPGSLSGWTASLAPAGRPHYALNLADATLGSTDTNVFMAAANYAYTRTGQDTATLSFQSFSPSVTTNWGQLLFLFSSAQGGVYFNTNGFEAGSFAIAPALATAPATLVGHTIHLRDPRDGAPVAIKLSRGSLNVNVGGEVSAGTYQLFHPGPQTLTLEIEPEGAFPETLQLNFSSPTQGMAIIYSEYGMGMAPFVLR